MAKIECYVCDKCGSKWSAARGTHSVSMMPVHVGMGYEWITVDLCHRCAIDILQNAMWLTWHTRMPYSKGSVDVPEELHTCADGSQFMYAGHVVTRRHFPELYVEAFDKARKKHDLACKEGNFFTEEQEYIDKVDELKQELTELRNELGVEVPPMSNMYILECQAPGCAGSYVVDGNIEDGLRVCWKDPSHKVRWDADQNKYVERE